MGKYANIAIGLCPGSIIKQLHVTRCDKDRDKIIIHFETLLLSSLPHSQNSHSDRYFPAPSNELNYFLSFLISGKRTNNCHRPWLCFQLLIWLRYSRSKGCELQILMIFSGKGKRVTPGKSLGTHSRRPARTDSFFNVMWLPCILLLKGAIIYECIIGPSDSWEHHDVLQVSIDKNRIAHGAVLIMVPVQAWYTSCFP